MNVFELFQQHIYNTIKNLYPQINIDDINIEIPKNNIYGNFASNIAFIIAKQNSMSPKNVAINIKNAIQQHEFINKIEIKNNGFINIKVNNKLWNLFLTRLLEEKTQYPIFHKKNKKVNIEFVSANPTGPLHIGHAKSAIVGDVLSNIYKKFGYTVIKEYYINDTGNQIRQLVRSVYIRYKQLLGFDMRIDNECYPGKYLIKIAKNLQKQYGDHLQYQNDKNTISNFTIDAIINIIKYDLKKLGIQHDMFTSEVSIMKSKIIERAIDILSKKKLLYTTNVDNNKKILSLRVQDDKDRVLIKNNGEYTYFASDIGYHKNKIERGFNKIILLLGADHIGYQKRLETAVRNIGGNDFKIKICQLVTLIKQNKKIKISKRSGNFILIQEILNKINIETLRFSILQKACNTKLNIDVQKVLEQDKNNHIFYVQYACARAHSIIRKTEKIKFDWNKIDTSFLNEEMKLIYTFIQYPKIITSCIETMEPHKITYYLYEIASTFHYLWNKGNTNCNYKFSYKNDIKLTTTRIALVKIVIYVITSGLKLLGIKAVTKM